VQFAGLGKPLYGDQRYNKTARAGQQIALYAYSLTFEHPTLRESMTFTSVPHGASWADFTEELAALTNGVRCAYIDEKIIAVNKQSDISVAVADGGEDTLEARLSLAFGEAYPVHRLDAATSGLVLFARSEAAREELIELFASRDIKKLYRTYVFGVPPKKEDVLLLHAEKDSEGARVSVFDRATRHSREMKTGYRVVKTSVLNGEKVSLLEIELFTGRTHQIRASLAHIGCPVVGDDKYGDRRKNRLFPDRLLLAAVRLEFPKLGGVLADESGRVIAIEPPFGVNSRAELCVCRA
jgi:23S rRNA pseudouridine955/2504/2580 synthase